ncbi:MAG: hypothetical protein EZS28_033373 [Streblomastix strix]|uniref:U-box domain-containing protein n=1 Tax=Streblomastix strix TaxID=222440 RepID=A0A5J4UM28_9EUKA|nr:MAG: hypothetical protein EZS28_033373 [Streblomastix strix]
MELWQGHTKPQNLRQSIKGINLDKLPIQRDTELLNLAKNDREREKFLNNINKILSQTPDCLDEESTNNRMHVGKQGMNSIVQFLNPGSDSTKLTSIVAGILLNLCFEDINVQHFLELNCTENLVLCLLIDDIQLQTNAAGAIQSICYHQRGKIAIRDAGGIEALSHLLSSKDSRLVTRVVGSLHNISSEISTAPIILSCGSVPHLVHLLDSHQPAIVHAAAGTIQNITCYPQARVEVESQGAIVPLLKLLVGFDPQITSCAIGAMLNLWRERFPDPNSVSSPDSNVDQTDDQGSNAKNKIKLVHPGMKKLLELAVTLGSAYNLFFPNETPQINFPLQPSMNLQTNAKEASVIQ